MEEVMTDNLWGMITYFTPKEEWGDWRKVYADLIFALDAFRKFVGKPVHINGAYSAAGHTDDSYHYKGMAVDIHVKDMHIIDQYIAATRFDEFNGIGVYPHWATPGLHLDIRPYINRFSPEARWMRVDLKNKGKIEKTYIGLTAENIKKYCM